MAFYGQYPIEGGGSGGGGVSSLNSLTGALSLIAGAGISITPSGSDITIAATGGDGTVTSVGLIDGTGLFTISGSPVTTSGNLTLSSFTNKAANEVFAGPTSGGPGTPSFRMLVAADIPDLSGVYANTALSNLTSPTAINQDLTFGAGAFSIGMAINAASSGYNLNISGGESSSTNPSHRQGGNLNLSGGTSDNGNGGPANLTGGDGGTVSGSGGGGPVNITGGTGNGAGSGGTINITSGSSNGTGPSGDVNIDTASTTGSTSGAMNISTGNGTGASSGTITIQPGASDTAQGGNVIITAGDSTSGGAGGVNIQGGLGTNPFNSGGVALFDGNTQNTLQVNIAGIIMVDSAGNQIFSANTTDRELDDFSGNLSIDFGNRIIYASDGATENINYSSPARVSLGTVANFFNAASDPGSSLAGDCYYNTTLNALRLYNGTTWQTIPAV